MGSRAIAIDPQAGAQFRAVRKHLFLSQEEMAEVCEISQALVSAIELGNRDIPLIALKNLYEKYNISPVFFIDRDAPMKIKKPRKAAIPE